MKYSKAIQFAFVLVLLSGCGTSLDPSSSNGGSSSFSSSPTREVSKKSLDVYEKGKVNCTVNAYYLDDVDHPYLNLRELSDKRMTERMGTGIPLPDYEYSYSNGILTCSQSIDGQVYSIYIDAGQDLIYSDYYTDAISLYGDNIPYEIITGTPSPIVRSVSEKRVPLKTRTEFDLGDYDIDLYAYNDTVLIPLCVANPIFFLMGDKSYAYNGRAIFNGGDTVGSGKNRKYYYTYLEEEKNVKRNDSTATFFKNSLFWVMDSFYGRMDESVIHGFESFAKSIGVYEKLCSPYPLTFTAGLAELITKIDDIHSYFCSPAPSSGDNLGSDASDVSANDILLNRNGLWEGYRSRSYFEAADKMATLRYDALGENPSEKFTYNGDTCFIRFDGFVRSSNSKVFLADHVIGSVAYPLNTYNLFYDAFKDLKENHTEVKNIIIDESYNSGGDATTLVEIAGFFMEKVSLSLKNEVTGEVFQLDYQVDTNYDGVYDESDFQAKDYNVYCLATGASFSCGNLLPMVLKENKAATIIGQTTAGGCTPIMLLPSGGGDLFTISGNLKMGSTNSDGDFLSNDQGVSPEILVPDNSIYNETKLLAIINGQ